MLDFTCKPKRPNSLILREQGRKETADRTSISHSVFIWYSMHLPFQREKTQSEVSHFNKSPTSSFTS